MNQTVDPQDSTHLPDRNSRNQSEISFSDASQPVISAAKVQNYLLLQLFFLQKMNRELRTGGTGFFDYRSVLSTITCRIPPMTQTILS